MTLYQAYNATTGDLILEGSIVDIQTILPAGSRVMTESEKKSHKIKDLCDAYRTMDGKVIKIKLKQPQENEL